MFTLWLMSVLVRECVACWQAVPGHDGVAHAHISHQQGLLVLHPDILLSGRPSVCERSFAGLICLAVLQTWAGVPGYPADKYPA